MDDTEIYELGILKNVHYESFVPSEIYVKIRLVCAYEIMSTENGIHSDKQILNAAFAFFRLVIIVPICYTNYIL